MHITIHTVHSQLPMHTSQYEPSFYAPSSRHLRSLLSERGGPSCGRLWCCSCRVFVCVTCFSLPDTVRVRVNPGLMNLPIFRAFSVSSVVFKPGRFDQYIRKRLLIKHPLTPPPPPLAGIAEFDEFAEFTRRLVYLAYPQFESKTGRFDHYSFKTIAPKAPHCPSPPSWPSQEIRLFIRGLWTGQYYSWHSTPPVLQPPNWIL